MVLGTRRGLVLVLAVGVLGTGLVVAALASAGLGTLGSAVWVTGYGATVFVLWYGWVRPLDLGGSAETEPAASADESPGSQES